MELITVFVLLSCVVVATAVDCPSGWVSFGSSCYHFSHDKEVWMVAQLVCQGFGGHLAEIETPEEDAFLENEVKLLTDVWYWIGLTDLEVEGDWRWWSNKRPLSYKNWGPGEPNSGAAENCAHIKKEPTGQTGWNDYVCSNVSNYICEMEREPTEIVG